MAKTKKRTKRSVPIDRPLAKELALSAANDGTLYRQQISSCITNLAKKKAKGIYKREGAIRLMVYPIQSELAKYRRSTTSLRTLAPARSCSRVSTCSMSTWMRSMKRLVN
jgi:hypothetical protein